MTLQAAHTHLAAQIDAAFEERSTLAPASAPPDIVDAVCQALDLLDSGKARVAEKINGRWQVNEWLKKAVLLSFRLFDNRVIEAGYTRFFDKVPLKYAQYDEARFRTAISDGIEADFIEFNSGAVATITLADVRGHLVVP